MKKYYTKIGKEIVVKQGIINHIRKKYSSNMEIAYLTENNILEKPLCDCSELAEFMNFFEGYSKECNICRKNRIENSSNNMQLGSQNGVPIYRRFDILEFFDFYYKNWKFYPEQRESLLQTGVIEPYTRKNTKSYTMYGYISKIFGPEHFPDLKVSCLDCKKVSTVSFLQEILFVDQRCVRG